MTPEATLRPQKPRRKSGKPIGELDAQIAAIAHAHNAAVATRNVEAFADCGVRVVSPWDQ